MFDIVVYSHIFRIVLGFWGALGRLGDAMGILWLQLGHLQGILETPFVNVKSLPQSGETKKDVPWNCVCCPAL